MEHLNNPKIQDLDYIVYKQKGNGIYRIRTLRDEETVREHFYMIENIIEATNRPQLKVISLITAVVADVTALTA